MLQLIQFSWSGFALFIGYFMFFWLSTVGAKLPSKKYEYLWLCGFAILSFASGFGKDEILLYYAVGILLVFIALSFNIYAALLLGVLIGVIWNYLTPEAFFIAYLPVVILGFSYLIFKTPTEVLRKLYKP